MRLDDIALIDEKRKYKRTYKDRQMRLDEGNTSDYPLGFML
jgi:hypothetical protein